VDSRSWLEAGPAFDDVVSQWRNRISAAAIAKPNQMMALAAFILFVSSLSPRADRVVFVRRYNRAVRNHQSG
jgi:hypothetical protein